MALNLFDQFLLAGARFLVLTHLELQCYQSSRSTVRRADLPADLLDAMHRAIELPSDTAATESDANAEPQQTPRILLADDSEDNVFLVRS